METLAVIKEVRKLMKACLLSQSQKTAFIRQLDSIENRCHDTNLYVGIVGEFSSGKSTLINSLIGRDYFVTNSIQGTTTVVTSIRYGNSINLELRYKDGKVEKYSSNKLTMIERILPDEYENLSFTDKIKIKAGDFFGANGKDEFMLKIFDIVTTSNTLSQELDEVAIHYPSDFLKTGIVLLDTPGTDSMNPIHTEITVGALANKCDMAFVLIPSDSPVSITLADFISENLFHCINDCHFLVTKIELIRKEKERDELLSWVTNRLKYNLGVENPHVVAAPTLLSLEERQIIEPTGLLDDLKQSARKSLMEHYDNEIAHLFEQLSNTKLHLIQSTINKQLKDLFGEIKSSLYQLRKDKQDFLTEKQANRTPSLDSLIEKVERKELSMAKDVILDRIRTKFSEVREDFECCIDNIISNASTKDEIQGSIRTEKAFKKGEQSFEECFEFVIGQVNWMIESYKAEISTFEENFENAYTITPLEFIPAVTSEVISIKNYKDTFSSFSLSTFPLKRMFIKKERIREEMREAIKSHLKLIFEKLYDYYSIKILKNYEKIEKQVDKLLQKYLKNFTKVINVRINHEMEFEKSIIEEINLINTQTDKIEKFEELY